MKKEKKVQKNKRQLIKLLLLLLAIIGGIYILEKFEVKIKGLSFKVDRIEIKKQNT